MRNTKITKTILLTLVTGTGIFALAACGDSPESSTAPEQSEQSATQESTSLEGIFLAEQPADPIPVAEAREVAEPGQPLTVTGRVGGTLEPFAEEFALVTLIDDSVQTCERIAGDSCPTPWDACCAGPDDLAQKRLTVQVLDEQGNPINQSLKGVKGLKELDTLIVKGTAAEGSTPENLIINAESLYQPKS